MCIRDSLYIIQHELLKDKNTDFAGVIIKHPLTNEIWMRVNSKSNPMSQISAAVETRGIIISGITDFIFFLLHSTNASKIAVHCIW